ncbi:MAG TPA: branched-chain amino acid ABC transporter permease [Methanophagales archaeon]|nr:branched-chain amino acid ABC transporter permease [Methanophagales archaeon]
MIEYIITVLLIAAIYAIFALGLNLEWGFTGLINFGHVAFMAIGAYTTALLNLSGVPVLPSVIAGMSLAGLCGGMLGIPTLKLREDYLAIVTIGFAEIIRFFLLNEEWLTRGPMGLHGYSRPFEELMHGDYNFFLLLFVLVVLVVCYLMLEKLIKSPWGRVLKSIREDEDVPTSLGKNVFSYKIQSLVLGSTIAGLAGSLLAFYLQYINPRNFMPIETFYAWIVVVLGGSGNNKGTLLGAVILWSFFSGTRFAQEYLPLSPTQMGALRIMFIGVLLIILMMFKPEGLLGKKEELTLKS